MIEKNSKKKDLEKGQKKPLKVKTQSRVKKDKRNQRKKQQKEENHGKNLPKPYNILNTEDIRGLVLESHVNCLKQQSQYFEANQANQVI
jgi:antirestriction protein ArdC